MSSSQAGNALQEGVELVDPQLRQFSELPLWMKANAERLEGRKVLMYCTGGVRCERASALLKGMGPGYQNVSQLEGSPLPPFPPNIPSPTEGSSKPCPLMS